MNWEMFIEETVKYFLGVSVITAGMTYVVKLIIKMLMDRNLEKYKNELSKEISLELEQAKKEFERINKESEIKFSKLHEERANAIKELYKRLVEVQIFFQTFYSQSFDKFNRYYKFSVSTEHLFTKISDFVEFYEQNKLLFSDEAYNALRILHDAFNLIYVSNTKMLDDLKNQDELRQGCEEILNVIIPEQKALLEKEFRSNIGIES